MHRREFATPHKLKTAEDKLQAYCAKFMAKKRLRAAEDGRCAQIIGATTGVGLDRGERFVLLDEVIKGPGKPRVLLDIGEVSGMEEVLTGEHQGLCGRSRGGEWGQIWGVGFQGVRWGCFN